MTKVIKSPTTGKFERIKEEIMNTVENTNNKKSIDEICENFKGVLSKYTKRSFKVKYITGYVPGDLVTKIYEVCPNTKFKNIDLNAEHTVAHFSNGNKVIL